MNRNANITSIQHNICSGCAACRSVCPVQAISMEEARDGFLYPSVDPDRCIHCAKCVDVCHTGKENRIWNDDLLFAGYFSDPKMLAASSSGGAATAISELVLRNKGVVYGVAYSDDFRSEIYCAAETEEELEPLRSSKYAQSAPPDYDEIKKNLESDRFVCFFGLPCQCDALHSYLGKTYPNLLLVSLVCHGPTSPLVLRKYIDELEDKYGKIKKFKFRYKKNGFTRPSRTYCEFENGRKVLKPFITSSFGMAFEILNRESCSSCHSKYPNGFADLMIGDFWGGKSDEQKQNEKGESMLILRNREKLPLIEELQKDGFHIEQVDLKGIEKKNPSLTNCSHISSGRRKLIDDLQTIPLKKAIQKNVSLKTRLFNRAYYFIRSAVPKNLWQRMR